MRGKKKEWVLLASSFRPSFDRWTQLVTILGFSPRAFAVVSLLTMARDRFLGSYCRAKYCMPTTKPNIEYAPK